MKSHATWCHSRSCDGDCGHASAFVNYDEINDLKAQLAKKDREIERLVRAIGEHVAKRIETQAALDLLIGAINAVALVIPDEFEPLVQKPFSNPAILKRQKELDAMEKIIYLCQTHKILEPECGCDICNALSELDAVRGGKG